MNKRTGILISYLFSTFFLIACQAAFRPARPPWPAAPDGYFMHVGAFLQVTGTAKTTAGNTSESREQAIVDAWNRLLAYLHRLPLAGYGYVKVKAEEDPAFAKRLEQLAYSAQVVETRHLGNDTAAVIRIGKSRINQLLETDFK